MLGKQKCCNGGLEARRGHLTSAPWLSLPGLNCCCCGEMLSITRCTHPMTKRWIFLRKCKRVTIDKMGIKVNTFRLYNAQHKYEIGQNTTVKNMLNLVKCSIVKTGKHCKLSNLIKSCPLKLEAAYFVARLPHKPIKLATSSVAVILVLTQIWNFVLRSFQPSSLGSNSVTSRDRAVNRRRQMRGERILGFWS